MTTHDSAPFRVEQPSPDRWPHIRRFVDSHLSEEARRLPWQSVLDGLANGQLAASGLLEAHVGPADDEPLGVVWVQPQDGRVANLLTPVVPALAGDEAPQADRIAHELLDAAVRVVATGGARLVQALAEADVESVAGWLQCAGFQRVAELLYLVSSPENFPTSAPVENLEFEPWTAAANSRLEAIVEQSYVGTRDCPELNGVRQTAEVLAGYRSVGPFDARRWLLARHAGQDIGCLLLVEHPQRIWELAYMGLVPEARGYGWGLDLTRHGQWLARQGGASRFVLAVAASNDPALRTYAAAGMVCWDRRAAWLKILDPANKAGA